MMTNYKIEKNYSKLIKPFNRDSAPLKRRTMKYLLLIFLRCRAALFHLRPLFVEHFVCCTKYLMTSSALGAGLGQGGGVEVYI